MNQKQRRAIERQRTVRPASPSHVPEIQGPEIQGPEIQGPKISSADPRALPSQSGSAAPVLVPASAQEMAQVEPLQQEALRRHRAGRPQEAAALYQQVLTAVPGHWSALQLLGVALHQTGQHSQALPFIDRSLALNAAQPGAWSNRGLVLQGLKRFEEAETSFRRALSLAPDASDALANLGFLLQARSRFTEALACFQKLHQVHPERIDAPMQIGVVLAELGRHEEAINAFTFVLKRQPDHPLAPGYLGAALRALGRLEEAIPYFQRMVDSNPNHPDNHANLGVLYKDQGLVREARTCFQRAYSMGNDPSLLLKQMTTLPIIPRSVAEIAEVRQTLMTGIQEFNARGYRLADPQRQAGQTCFYLAYHAQDDRPLQEAVAGLYARACPSLLYVAPHCQPGAGPAEHNDGRIHVGFVSEHFYLHTIGQLNHGLLQHLPKERFHITVFLTARPMDRLRQAIADAADVVVDIPFDLAEARQRIAAQRLDVLYFPDIGMTPFTYFLAFSRLAPVQTLTWGHPDTTGLPTIDYFLSCAAMEPDDGDRHYSETLIRLPGPSVYYHRPAFAQPFKPRAGYGLPDDAHIYACPQSLFKIHPDYDPLLIDILRRDPEGLLVFVENKHPNIFRLLHARLAALGPDVATRIIAVSPMSTVDFVGLMRVSDVMLDPWHYSGGNTSLEALSQGTPIVTLPGAFMRGRHTLGWYKLMGYTELVARDPAHYVELAVRLGTDSDWRQQVRQSLHAASPVLYEQQSTVDAIADTLTTLVARQRGHILPLWGGTSG